MIEIHWTWLACVPIVGLLIWVALSSKEKVINGLATLRIIKMYKDAKGIPQHTAQLFNPISWVIIVVISLLSGGLIVFDTGFALVSDALTVGKRVKKPAK